MSRRENEFDQEITAWFESQPKPTPEERATAGKIVDRMLEALGCPPRVSSERLVSKYSGRDDLFGREDVQATGNAIVKEVDEGKLSASSLTAWRRHLFANYFGVSPSNKLLLDLPPILGADSSLLAKTHIDEDQQLGPKVDSVLFTGDHLHSITLARASLRTPQAMHDILSTNLGDLQRLVSQKPGFVYRVTRDG